MKKKDKKVFERIKNVLKDNESFLKEKYKVKEICIFGSNIRKESFENDGLNILVEFYDTISIPDFVELENTLTDLIGVKVNLVKKSSLDPKIGKHIMREVIQI